MLLNTNSIINQRYRVIKQLNSSEFGETYEVEDLKELWLLKGKNKILKCLKDADEESVKYFKKEVDALSELRHPGIPKVDPETCYFEYIPENSFKPIHCLVMEKIEGLNLQEWLEQKNDNKPIDEQRAIAWLFQLLEILEYLNKKQYIHLDIKPSNIMLTPNGQLVLIDFGGAINKSDTYILKLGKEGQKINEIASRGYTAPEQLEGTPYTQSQFFSLGRTFVYLLTGKHPDDFSKNRRERKIIWQDSNSNISSKLVKLLDKMMAHCVDDRYRRIKEIRQDLEKIGTPKTKALSWVNQPGCKIALGGSAIATLIMGVRLTGLLQSWELAAFDGMMRSRPAEPIDPRILVVEVTQEDLGGKYPVEDATLAELIEKIAQHQPRVIGLDMHRYQARPPGRKELLDQFQENSNLLTVCAALDSTPNFYPPGEFSQKQLKEQVGYSDLIKDYWIDNSIRRQFLSYNPKFTQSPTCITPYSLSLMLAKRFLQAEGKPLTTLPDGDWHHDQVILKPLNARTGGYQNLSGDSNEILINYRSNPKPAETATLTQVLAGINPELVKDRIVLIGYTAKVARDNFNTPLGEMAGVWIHAQMTSQIISAVMDKRPLLWTLPEWGDAIFVWIWSLAGGAIALSVRSRRGLVVPSVGVAAIALYLICYGSFVIGGWLPLVPSVLSLFTSGVLVFYITSKN